RAVAGDLRGLSHREGALLGAVADRVAAGAARRVAARGVVAGGDALVAAGHVAARGARARAGPAHAEAAEVEQAAAAAIGAAGVRYRGAAARGDDEGEREERACRHGCEATPSASQTRRRRNPEV